MASDSINTSEYGIGHSQSVLCFWPGEIDSTHIEGLVGKTLTGFETLYSNTSSRYSASPTTTACCKVCTVSNAVLSLVFVIAMASTVIMMPATVAIVTKVRCHHIIATIHHSDPCCPRVVVEVVSGGVCSEPERQYSSCR